jgi:diaminobutyrate-2-oxoglutarate transaminase
MSTGRHQAVDRFAPDLVETRGRGMMRGIRCADLRRVAAVTANAFARGLVVECGGPHDEIIKCLMSLRIRATELDKGLDVLKQALVNEFGEGTLERRRRSGRPC